MDIKICLGHWNNGKRNWHITQDKGFLNPPAPSFWGLPWPYTEFCVIHCLAQTLLTHSAWGVGGPLVGQDFCFYRHTILFQFNMYASTYYLFLPCLPCVNKKWGEGWGAHKIPHPDIKGPSPQYQRSSKGPNTQDEAHQNQALILNMILSDGSQVWKSRNTDLHASAHHNRHFQGRPELAGKSTAGWEADKLLRACLPHSN